MNNPPDISQDSKEYEEYAHGIRKHVRGYLMVGATLLVFIYMWLPVSKRLYQRNPEHLANRVEVSGLFWHFVDLIWIFVFPLFYLL